MIKIPRYMEYALLALYYIAQRSISENLITAKNISDNLDIPFEQLAKILQKLSKNGILSSTQGIKGGYLLNKSLDDIKILDIFIALNDNKISQSVKITRQLNSYNKITTPINIIEHKLFLLFNNTTLKEIYQ